MHNNIHRETLTLKPIQKKSLSDLPEPGKIVYFCDVLSISKIEDGYKLIQDQGSVLLQKGDCIQVGEIQFEVDILDIINKKVEIEVISQQTSQLQDEIEIDDIWDMGTTTVPVSRVSVPTQYQHPVNTPVSNYTPSPRNTAYLTSPLIRNNTIQNNSLDFLKPDKNKVERSFQATAHSSTEILGVSTANMASSQKVLPAMEPSNAFAAEESRNKPYLEKSPLDQLEDFLE
jgi:predicted component of type VI protein secretion system